MRERPGSVPAIAHACAHREREGERERERDQPQPWQRKKAGGYNGLLQVDREEERNGESLRFHKERWRDRGTW